MPQKVLLLQPPMLLRPLLTTPLLLLVLLLAALLVLVLLVAMLVAPVAPREPRGLLLAVAVLPFIF